MKLLSLAFIFFSLPALAGEGFPFQKIFFQVLNFSGFLVLLIIFTRKPLKRFFKKREEDFFKYAREARELRSRLEASKKEWQDKLESLAREQSEIEQKALEIGKEFQKTKAQELQVLEEKLRRDEEEALSFESEHWRQEFLKLAKSELTLQTRQKLRSQQEEASRFLKKMEVLSRG